MTLETAAQVLAKTNDQRLKDIHWDVRGPGQVVEKFGDDGKVIGGTTTAIEIGWQATNFARVIRRLDALTLKVDALAAQPAAAAPVDVQALAAQLAPLLTAGQVEQFVTAIRTQWNK
jgi:hypothetical protein